MRGAFARSLVALAEHDPRVWLLTGDLGFSVLEPFAERFPERFVNVGVAEQNMIGVAAGLAHSGKRVFVYSIANFPTLRCLEQIRNDVCYHGLPVRIVSVGGGVAYGAAGFISKRSGLDELQQALRAVLACETWLPPALRGAVAATSPAAGDRELAARLASLSPQQMRVLALVAEGLLNKQIAARLDVQERTVKAHLTAVFERLGVRNRTQAGVLLRSLTIDDPARSVDAGTGDGGQAWVGSGSA